MQQPRSLLIFLRKKAQKSALLVVFTLLLTPGFINGSAQAKENPRYASIVMDADTGLILHQRYANKSLHPASLTKVMTLYLVFEALEEGRLRLNDQVKMSRHAASMVPSKLNIPAGSTIKVQDAIYALVTKSANDVAVALGEHLGGTESNFARMMTRKAHDIGMTRTTFRNASGLHNPAQISSARDMAIMARMIINQYPEYYRYFSTQNFTYKGASYHNHNRLLGKYKGMDGLKTGYVAASGFNLIASAVRDNRRIIGVVFGGRSAASRNAHMVTLLDSGFSQLNNLRIASTRVPLPPRKPEMLVALSSLNKLSPSTGTISTGFNQIIGEGDYDPAASSRIETGMLAINAVKGVKTQPLTRTSAVDAQGWAIQVGAFKSRAATDRAISNTVKKLPKQYASANPIIAPLKTENGWLFRGRLSGYSKSEAYSACKHIKDCLPVAPQNQ